MKKGHTFRSPTDSEVILHAYEEWGTECLARLNGMWAFAIWDEKRQQLFCARDRLGIKPFYYAWGSGSLLFASEIKALNAHPEVGKRPDDEQPADGNNHDAFAVPHSLFIPGGDCSP